MFKRACLFVVAVFYAGCVFSQDSVPANINNDSLICFAQKFLGTPYKYGASSPKGFDCSGFVYYVYKNFGLTLPRTSRGMAHSGSNVEFCDYRKGDIILFKGTNASKNVIGHAGIVISEPGEPLKFIHSSSNKNKYGVIISEFDESPYYKKRFVKIVRPSVP